MTCFICGIAFLASLLVSSVNADDVSTKDLARIQGIWRLASIEVPDHEFPPREQPKNATMTIKGNKMLRSLPDGTAQEYEFKLNASAAPKAIDIHFPGANDKKSKQDVFGVYSLEGDELKMCTGRPSKERPKELKKTEANAVLVFRREKPSEK